MSFNQIIKKTITGSVVKNGKTYNLSVATKTDHWNRPEAVAQGVGDRLYNLVDKWTGEPPAGTIEICARESEHSSADPKRHMTVVCFDSANKGTSQHIPEESQGSM